MQIRVSSAGYEVAHPQIRPSLATTRMPLLTKSQVELPAVLARMRWGSVLSGSTVPCGCGLRFAAELENAVPAKRRDLDAASMFDMQFL
jgi:hypothetical protein